jgi:hypothetical protein
MEFFTDPVALWTSTVPQDPKHICGLECKDSIKQLDEIHGIYACRIGGNIHYCQPDVDCERMVINEDGAHVCLWSGKIHYYHLDPGSEYYSHMVTGSVVNSSESTYTSLIKEKTVREKRKKDRSYIPPQSSSLKNKYKQSPSTTLLLPITKKKKAPKTTSTTGPIQRHPEESKLLNQQKTLAKRKKEISAALEYLIWNDDIRRQRNAKVQKDLTDQMSNVVNRFIKDNKRFPDLQYLDEQYAQVKGKKEFIPLINMTTTQLIEMKNGIAQVILSEYERLVIPKSGQSIRFLYFIIGYILLMAKGSPLSKLTTEQSEFLDKYLIDTRLLHLNEGQMVIVNEKQKKTQITNINKNTICNARKDTKALFTRLYPTATITI